MGIFRDHTYSEHHITVQCVVPVMSVYESSVVSRLLVISSEPCTSDGTDGLVTTTPQVSDGAIRIAHERCIIEW